jgi:hypothetical protein
MTTKDKGQRREGDEGVTEFHTTAIYECWCIARDEANRYQELANRPKATVAQREAYLAKRNAASRIARLIRYGHAAIGSDKGDKA